MYRWVVIYSRTLQVCAKYKTGTDAEEIFTPAPVLSSEIGKEPPLKIFFTRRKEESLSQGSVPPQGKEMAHDRRDVTSPSLSSSTRRSSTVLQHLKYPPLQHAEVSSMYYLVLGFPRYCNMQEELQGL